MTIVSAPVRVLIVDDEPSFRRFMSTSLAAQGYLTTEAGDGQTALGQLRQGQMDVVILDLGMPIVDGFEVIQKLRDSGSTLPIIVSSGRVDEADKVRAFNMGADDYLTKPFGVDELLARIRAALRHQLQQQGQRAVFNSGEFSVDLVRRIVTVRGREVKLSPREYDLLRVLVAHA